MIFCIKKKFSFKGTSNEPMTTATTYTTTITMPTIGILCYNGNGYYPNVTNNCQSFYLCFGINTPMQNITYFNCPAGMWYSSTTSLALGSCVSTPNMCTQALATKSTTIAAKAITTTKIPITTTSIAITNKPEMVTKTVVELVQQ
jgi:hypothetical protein